MSNDKTHRTLMDCIVKDNAFINATMASIDDTLSKREAIELVRNVAENIVKSCEVILFGRAKT